MYLRADPDEKLEAITKVAESQLARGRFRVPDKLIASLMPGDNAARRARVHDGEHGLGVVGLRTRRGSA